MFSILSGCNKMNLKIGSPSQPLQQSSSASCATSFFALGNMGAGALRLSQLSMFPNAEARKEASTSKMSTPVMITDETQNAEILYSLFVLQANASFRSTDEISNLFRWMFPDSGIAKSYSCGKTKTMYLLNYGLVEYFKRQLEQSSST